MKTGNQREEENRDIRKRVELLAPAGSLETLRAVAAAGADAVYAAGGKFGARAYAGNLTEQELLTAIDYLHLHDRKLYLTVNTLLKEQEIFGELYDYMLPLYKQGLSGVIVQDLGVLTFLREQFPGLELHASTQMTITGSYGARLMKELGCCRIVPARELSLKEILEIHDNVDIEIETFIHGALCYCYSGQCLMSSMLGGRSGNRGRCAQPCRLPYQVKGAKDTYLLSMKDLCTIEILPELIEHGIYSLKIEGRMKQVEYAAGVTSIYREYLDRYLKDRKAPYIVDKKDMQRLLDLGNRSGFTKGYYHRKNGPDMMALKKPAHEKGDEKLQEEVRENFVNQGLQEKMKGILKLSKEMPAKFVVQCKGICMEITGDEVQKARSLPLDELAVKERLSKTGGSNFIFEELKVEMEDDVFLPVNALNRLRREAIGALERELLKKYQRGEELLQSGRETYVQSRPKGGEQSKAAGQEPFLAVSVRTLQQGRKVLGYPYVRRIDIDHAAFLPEQEMTQFKEFAKAVQESGKQLYYRLPMVMRKDTTDRYAAHMEKLIRIVDGFVAGNPEALGFLLSSGVQGAHILADSSLYVMNRSAKETLAGLGIMQYTLPLEANEKELAHRSFSDGELILYGYLPLMVSAQCLRKNTTGCVSQSGFMTMRDRYGKNFQVENRCEDCYNVLYNTSPLSLLHQRETVQALKAESYRISFTLEDELQLSEVMSYYERGFLQGENLRETGYLEDYTNGHLKRGVE